MKNKKQHVFISGYQGIIYYSWLFVILFIGLIFEMESPDGGYSIPGIIIMAVFLVLAIYSYLTTYLIQSDDHNLIVKLPFLKQKKFNDADLTRTINKRTTSYHFKNFGFNLLQFHKKEKVD